QPAKRLHQAESGLLVIGEGMARDGATIDRVEPDGLRLGDEISDRQHHPILADDDAVAGALGAERLRREAVGGHGRPHGHGRRQRALEIEIPIFGLGLRLSRNVPFAGRWHGGLLLVTRKYTPGGLATRGGAILPPAATGASS